MQEHRVISRFMILALILMMIFLPACQKLKTKLPAVAPPTSTVSAQNAVAEATQVFETNTPAAGEVATSTPAPAEVSNPTTTPVPTDTPAALPPTPTPPPATSLEGVYEPIPGCARSRLHWGDTVQVAPGIEYVRIRSTADTHPADNIIRRLYKSELAQTRGLPVCNYGWILWPIRTADGTLGWVPESDGNAFWLVKIEGSFFPTVTSTPSG